MLISHPELGICKFLTSTQTSLPGQCAVPWGPTAVLLYTVEGMHGRASDYGACKGTLTQADPQVYTQFQPRYLLCRPARDEPGTSWMPARLPAPPIPESAPGQVGLGRPRKPLPAAVPSFREAKDWHTAHGDCLPLHLPLALPGRTPEAQPPPTAQPKASPRPF